MNVKKYVRADYIPEDRDGKRYLVLHTPNVRKIFTHEYEHPVMLDIIKGRDK